MQDKKFFLLAIALQDATEDQLKVLVIEIDKIFARYTSGGRITNEILLQRDINRLIDRFYNVFVENLVRTGQAVGEARSQDILDEVMPLLNAAGLFRESIEFYNEVRSYSSSMRERMLFTRRDELTLDMRIKTIRAGTQTTVRNIIANGIAEGKGSLEISRDLRKYINPVGDDSVKPFDEYRKRFNRPKSFTPNGVPAGSVRYNALRIARTEAANVYREAAFDFYEDRFWVKGYQRILSNRHPSVDECDEYAKQVYENRDDVPAFHPNCLCDVITVKMTPQEIREYINATSSVEQRELSRV